MILAHLLNFLPVIIQGFKPLTTALHHRSKVASHFFTHHATHLNDNGGDTSMVAAASAASLCSISGNDSILKSWCDETMTYDIPHFSEGEAEDEALVGEESAEEELIWKDVPTEEIVSQIENRNDDVSGDEDLCLIDEAFDIGKLATRAEAISRKKTFRPTRRKHLFRYSPDISVSCWLSTVKPKELLLSAGYSIEDIERMSNEYPKILASSSKDMIAPKLRFLVSVLGAGTGDIGKGIALVETDDEYFVPHNLQVSEFARKNLPTFAFFNPRLETALAPRHAYLAFHGDTLPFGNELLEPSTAEVCDSSCRKLLVDEFLEACTKSPAEFAALCQKWESMNISNRSTDGSIKVHTADTVTAMDSIFNAGIAPFARNHIIPDLTKLGKPCTPAEAFEILLQHGANYAEHDDWGSTILHWTAGTGNIEAIKVLVDKLEQDEKAFDGDPRDVLWSRCASCSITRDGATPLHWAACGVSSNHFGCGGHEEVCRFLLDRAGERKNSLVNAVTSSGNSPLMWACWSASIDVSRLLVSSGADPQMRNDHGVTAAHWAACSGNVDICTYLHDDLGLDFQGPGSKDEGGQTPLDVALSFGHADVVEWIASTTHELSKNNMPSMEQATDRKADSKPQAHNM